MLKIKNLYMALLMLWTVSFVAQPALAQLSIGDALVMGDRKMNNTDGGQTSIADAKGEHGTAVIFWCNTCPWVKKYEDRVVALAKEYQNKGFGFILVNANDPVAYPNDNLAAMKQQASKKDYTFPYVVDAGSELAVAFDATRTPHVFLFDEADALAYIGAPDDSPADPSKVEEAFLRNALDALKAGSEVAPTITKAFGCTIKFPS